MLSEQKHEGLVLRSIDFRDRQKIITLFTPAMGMLSLIVKGISRKKPHLLTLTSPLTVGEYVFQTAHSALHRFVDGTPISTSDEIRHNLEHIEVAALFSKALLKSQLPEKPAPNLYILTLIYLNALPSFEDPSPLAASFLLKLLKHEGLFSSEVPLEGLSNQEWQIAQRLANLRTIQPIQETPTPQALLAKIEALFINQYTSNPGRSHLNFD